jgi:hypothetical protein
MAENEALRAALREAETAILDVAKLIDPTDVYFGRQYAVLSERSKIKRKTMERRKNEYLAQKAA